MTRAATAWLSAGSSGPRMVPATDGSPSPLPSDPGLGTWSPTRVDPGLDCSSGQTGRRRRLEPAGDTADSTPAELCFFRPRAGVSRPAAEPLFWSAPGTLGGRLGAGRRPALRIQDR